MRIRISLTDFTSGFDITLFDNELRASSFSSKLIENTWANKSYVNHKISSALTSGEETELGTIVANHAPITATEIESRAKNLPNHPDYYVESRAIRVLVNTAGFATLNQKEKRAVSRHNLAAKTPIVNYYQNQGDTATEAEDRYNVRLSRYIYRSALSCASKINSPVFMYILRKYMNKNNVSVFIDDTRSLVLDYKNVAYLGEEDGDNRSGLLDYIEGTNDYSVSGLQNLSFVGSYTWTDCRDELADYLRLGTIPSEYNTYI